MYWVRHTDYAQANPLLSTGSPCLLDRAMEFRISSPNILRDFLALLFNLCDGRFLLDNQGLKILEQLREFHHLLLNFLDILMSSSDVLFHS
jgi:hypothetical protein